MKTKLTILAFAVLSSFAFSGCKKEGCRDKDAENYNEDAKKDCDCCTYKGSVQFWYNQTSSANMVADGIISLTFYVDGVLIGSYAANVYFTGDPNCTQSSVVRSSKDLGKDKTKTSSYSVKDDLGFEIWAGSVTYDATKDCTSYQLTY